MRKLIGLVLLLASSGWAADSKNLDDKNVGVFDIYFSSTNDSQLVAGALSATHSVVGLAQSFCIESVGANTVFQLSHSTGTATRDITGAPIEPYMFFKSSEVVVRAGAPKCWDLRGRVEDPWVKILRFGSGGATAYVTIDYLMPLHKSSMTISATR